MPKFQKRPTIVEAVRLIAVANDNKVDFDFFDEPAPRWLNQAFNRQVLFVDNGRLCIRTLEGTMVASHGDYLVRGIKGELYPCKPDIFEKLHDRL